MLGCGSTLSWVPLKTWPEATARDFFDMTTLGRQPIRYLLPRYSLVALMDVCKAWENAISKAKIANFRFHDLRHSAARYMVMQGKSLKQIPDLLGHKTLPMVKRYSYLSVHHITGLAEGVIRKMFRL